ncbi:methyl-accepting chemotaxis protein [Jatrophihabitans sp. GAS493]|uniref:methyl-accepting chemotaxis protein n=1 Tax=Jatrophihabitans sp. GAS493 TaxID=1907575 RepID=UPI000BB74D35|nr:methyl-accepting chemotaxis protein [Jatrophihabitans sp. GAS493]
MSEVRRRPTSVVMSSIAGRLVAAFLVVTMATVAVGLVGLHELAALNAKAKGIYAAGAVPAEAVRGLEGTWFHYTTDLTQSGLTAVLPAAEIAAVTADSKVQIKKLTDDIASVQKMPLTPAASAAVTTLASDVANYLKDITLLPQALASGDRGQTSSLLAETQEIQNGIPAILASAATAQLNGAKAQAKAAESAYTRARTLIIVLMILGFGVGVAIALLTARSLIRPIRRTEAVLQRLAAGDLTGRVQTRGHDELARMGESLNTSLESVAEVVRLINTSAGDLADASDNLTGVASSISESADVAAGKAASVARSSEEVSANVATVATGADEMSVSIREIAVNASQAATVAADAMAVAETATQTISKLGDSSVEIGNVIKVITSIAAQTNLLALNATIEAARAGEAGKGFAVVASEVKELAQETARATDDIGQRVSAIQADTAGAVEAIERISEVIGHVHGFQITIASAVEEQNATTDEMGRNVGQAAVTSASIADGISAVAAATQTASDGARRSGEAATELAGMSAQLRGVISRFTA